MLSFNELRTANMNRNREWDPESKIGALFRSTEASGEMGEVCNVIKKLEREAMGLPGSRATRSQLAEELADVIICIDLIAMHYGLDLTDAVVSKFNASSEKVGLKERL